MLLIQLVYQTAMLANDIKKANKKAEEARLQGNSRAKRAISRNKVIQSYRRR